MLSMLHPWTLHFSREYLFLLEWMPAITGMPSNTNAINAMIIILFMTISIRFSVIIYSLESCVALYPCWPWFLACINCRWCSVVNIRQRTHVSVLYAKSLLAHLEWHLELGLFIACWASVRSSIEKEAVFWRLLLPLLVACLSLHCTPFTSYRKKGLSFSYS